MTRALRKCGCCGAAMATAIFVSFLVFPLEAAEPVMTNQLRERAIALGCEEIIFSVRARPTDVHFYASFGCKTLRAIPEDKVTEPWVDTPLVNRKTGSKLCTLNLRTGKVTTLLEDADGSIRDPFVHYDGKTILFSYLKTGSDVYKLYTIQRDGTQLHQLTTDHFNDIEPIYLPDGSIVFNSDRCKQFVPCFENPSATLYKSDGDGTNIRSLIRAPDFTLTPWVLPDGRILFTMWDYVNRHWGSIKGLWTMHPDGTQLSAYYGNDREVGTIVDAKPIPGTGKLIINQGGHGSHRRGNIYSLETGGDPSAGQLQPIAISVNDDPFKGNKGGRSQWHFCDPYPLSDSLFMMTFMDGEIRRKQILLTDGKTQEILYSLSEEDQNDLHEPRPLMPRTRENIIPSVIDETKTTGVFVLQNVYQGRNMAGIKPGTIKNLLILEPLPRPTTRRRTGGSLGAFNREVSLASGFHMERVLGTVPVDEDGSACFEAPANRMLLFIALDQEDKAAKAMLSFVNVQPGEMRGCVGCHEPRSQSAAASASPVLKALKSAPAKIQPIEGVPEILDYPRDIQPIWNKHCLSCHDTEKHKGRVIMSGEEGTKYSLSYVFLYNQSQYDVGGNFTMDWKNELGNRAPYHFGSGNAALLQKLEPTHHGVKMSESEKRRVRRWLDAVAPFPGTYAPLPWTGVAGVDVAGIRGKKCMGCHDADLMGIGPQIMYDNNTTPKWLQAKRSDMTSAFWLFNLSHPEDSVALKMTLDKKAGGWARQKEPVKTYPAGETIWDNHPIVFESKNDPDYQAFLASVVDAQRRLNDDKRFNMPGYKLDPIYLRFMKQYGVLPSDFQDDGKLSPYEIDRRYFESLWHLPKIAKPNQ